MLTEKSSSRWGKLLGDVLLAPSLPAAQIATAELIDEALPGGAALDKDVAALIDEIRVHSSFIKSPFRAYVLGALVALVPWAKTWRISQARGNMSEAAVQGAAAEARSLRAVTALWSEMRYFQDDSDPEVRSLAYLLTGSVGLPELEAARFLQRRTLVDVDQVARACAVQGVVLVLERLPSESVSDLAGWVRGVAAEDALVRARIRRELESVARPAAARNSLEELVGVRGAGHELSGEIPSPWPAESI